MNVITVDLDDTLIKTSTDYENAIDEFANYVNELYGVDKGLVKKTQREIDKELVEETGFKTDRFPTSFVKTLEKLVPYAGTKEKETVKEIGENTFKSVNEYKSRSFMKNAEQMLNEIAEYADKLHLVTVGEKELQQKKISALGLEEWFDEFHYVDEYDGKDEVITKLKSEYDICKKDMYHIGNSSTSDVFPAISVGVNAVYINQNKNWLETEDLNLHEEAMDFGVAVYEFKNHATVQERFEHILQDNQAGLITEEKLAMKNDLSEIVL